MVAHPNKGTLSWWVGTSFPRHTEFWAEPRNLPISAEFLCFRTILRNWVLASDKVRNMAYFGWFQIINYYPYMSRRRDCTVKYVTATRALTGYWAEFIRNTASLFGKQTCICQSQLPATNTVYLIGFSGPQKIDYIMWKICRGEPQNLANWRTEFGEICHGNCGPYWWGFNPIKLVYNPS